MSAGSLLLRVLLCLVLVSNGITAAVASVHMAAGHAMPAAAAQAASPSPSTPCHEGGDAGGHDTATPVADTPSAADGEPAPPDCCEAQACQCTCVQSVHATVLAWTISSGLPDRARHGRPFASAHAEPALPHLIRPPIG